MKALSMLQQQNLVDQSFSETQLKSVPVISKIDNEALKFKTLVSHLRMNKKRSNEPIQFCNDSQISNIEHKSDRCSFDIQLPIQAASKKPSSLRVSKINGNFKDQGDSALKYKPRSNVNGRDDIRIRNINEVHKQLIDSLQKKRNENNQQHQNIFQTALHQLQSRQKSSNATRSHIYTPNNKDKKYNLALENLQRKQSHTQKLRKYKNEEKIKTSNMRPLKYSQDPSNPEEFVDQIDPHSLVTYLKGQQRMFPASDSTPNEIYTFFVNICTYFGFKDYFGEPLIKRYQNCIYFGEKVKKQAVSTYNGFIWYYRKVLYYGQFTGGKKNGYGIEVDIQETNNQCIWRGTFLNGKKTGYFSMSNPQMEYNGSVKNSYFDGQGHLKTKKSTYQGGFQAGMKHGTGIENFHHKVLTYRGGYTDNKFQGDGQLEGPNYFYKGEFRSGKEHGKGFQRTKQFQYVGEFKNGVRSGQGVLKMNNGDIIKGIFKNGEIVYEQQVADQQPKRMQSYYTKNIPIQSPRKNLPHLKPASSILSSEEKQPLYNRSNRKGSKVILDKHLSKQLHALYQENQEGTIQNQRQRIQRYYESNYQRNKYNNQSDEQEPLQLKVLPQYN